MKLALVGLATFVLAACSHASPKPSAPPASTPAPRAQTRSKRVVTVPMALETNRPYIDVTLTGPDGQKATAHAWVDTGGGGILIAEPLAKRLGLKPSSKPIHEEGMTLVMTALNGLSIGGLEIDRTPTHVVISSGSGAHLRHTDAEVALPARALARYVVVFDYPAHTFTVALPGALKPTGKKVDGSIPLVGMPVVNVKVGGAPYAFLLDTGGKYNMLSAVVMKALEQRHPDWEQVRGAFGPGNMALGRAETTFSTLRIGSLEIGGVTLRDVGAVSRPKGNYERWMSQMLGTPIVGSIGGNVLKAFRVRIDYPANTIYLTHTGTADEGTLAMVGVTVEPAAKGGWEIAALRGKADGVQVGDQLLRVGTLDATKATLAQVLDALAGEPGETRTLELERGGKTLTVTAPVVSIF